jgi:hypothetical protein
MRFRLVGLLIVTAALFTLTGKCSAQDFEGKVSFNVFENDEFHPMEYLIKGSKFRFESNEQGRQGAIVMDVTARQFMIIMPEQKMYMVTNFPDRQTESGYTDDKDKDAKFMKTGETKEILGLTAEKWVYKNGDKEGEAWMAKGLGTFKFFDNPMVKNKPEWQQEIVKEGYFPLLVYDKGKKVYEVTKIEKQSLDNSLFEAPAGFQKMEVPNMQK